MRMETDVNYLLHRQQVSLIQAQGTRSNEGRAVYENLARCYIDQVQAYRQANARLIVPAQ